MPLDLNRHPCFNTRPARTHRRIHSAGGPAVQHPVQVSATGFDRVNESGPVVSSSILAGPVFERMSLAELEAYAKDGSSAQLVHGDCRCDSLRQSGSRK